MSKPRVRSSDADDYQGVPRPLAAMAKSFAGGFEIEPHQHPRDQLVYAVTGVMRVRTEREAWIVPPDRAVYLPAHTVHAISIHGRVEMRTLYIAGDARADLPPTPTVLEVSGLLRELVLAMIEEPVIYDEKGRAGAVAFLILAEIARARRLSLVIPMPRDPRLLRVCTALLADPASRQTLEGWVDTAGASVRTLARLFEAETALSFAVWRQRVRFHNALEAIVAGTPISQVAARNGYHSSSAFSAAFRKVMGQVPSSLRVDRPAA
ncbi:helix-turn-helix transcriptional regulator [Bradyrhizobium prioriisuperbiae]|uniref:AraC family transcriptional regulator n=1 Tax=Bradyrhizobium prioriisuperbiae TaxID=2854389 RepID=UPI0028E55405|nr:helix-turn-helix transcriptional regulator [Bradyrhizobium prioritasuperba]